MTIYQASDLNQKGRTILDEARNGEAHVRDKDGFALVMVPETRLSALTAVSRAAANLASLEEAFAQQADVVLPLASYGDWPWLRAFDREDLEEFAGEMREALIIGGREESVDVLEETLHRWRVTASALDDPLRRSVLLGRHAADDFVEVSRPE
jgi:hypothetical protein